MAWVMAAKIVLHWGWTPKMTTYDLVTTRQATVRRTDKHQTGHCRALNTHHSMQHRSDEAAWHSNRPATARQCEWSSEQQASSIFDRVVRPMYGGL